MLRARLRLTASIAARMMALAIPMAGPAQAQAQAHGGVTPRQPAPAVQSQQTAQAMVSWYASADRIDAGQTVKLIVEIVPSAGMRIYAPGQLAYAPVSLELDAAAPVKPGAVTLPAAVPHVFQPTGEASLVFDRPFRLELPVTMPRASAGRGGPRERAKTVVVSGTLHYQACDDAVCYKAQRVPLSWTFTR